MNKIWLIIISASIVALTIISPENVLTSFMGGSTAALNLALRLMPIYIIWSGLLAIMEASRASNLISRLFRPLIKRLFPCESPLAHEYISMNFAANLLGMGGAATPLGIKAINEMYKGEDKATHSMVLFTVINTSSIQLIPATMIAFRAGAGSLTSSDIILPTLIVSSLCTAFSIIAAKVIK